MGRPPKNKEEENNSEEMGDNVQTPQEQAYSYLKANKDDHYNFEESNYYKTPCSSLLVNSTIPGLTPGAHRFTGGSACGKTSCALDYMYHFLNEGENRRGIYCKCEGRLSPEVQTRSGIKFTTDPKLWSSGICLIIESNLYETIFGFLGEIIRNNATKTKYFTILDSLDTMQRKIDRDRSLEDSNLVAGGALITSVFFKKSAAALEKRGHILIFISQLRDEIKINQYAKTNQRQGNASGGHAIEHQGSVVYFFEGRFQDDVIRENPSDKNSKPIGHWCKIKVIKSDNEKYQQEIRYPIRYGRINGTSVWTEYEITDLLLAWQFVKKGGAWFSFDEDRRKEAMEKSKIELPEKIQGIDNLRKYLEDNKEVNKYFINEFKKII